MVRLTAKDTLFGKPTFSSWLIEASGALPMQRPKDHVGKKIDNSKVLEILMKVDEFDPNSIEGNINGGDLFIV